ncbi:MAG: HEAT repeat domain-containing protein [Chloracidobacterium sp.]
MSFTIMPAAVQTCADPIGPFIETLTYATRDTPRIDAVSHLAHHVAHPQVRSALLTAAVADKNWLVRSFAIKSLAKVIRQAAVYRQLNNRIPQEPNDLVRVALIATLRRVAGKPEVRTCLLQTSQADPSLLVRLEAVFVLKPFASKPEVQDCLLHTFQADPSMLVRLQAGLALKPFVARPPVRQALCAALGAQLRLPSPYTDTPLYALLPRLLAPLAHEPAIRDVLLTSLTQSGNWEIEQAAAEVLGRYISDDLVAQTFSRALTQSRVKSVHAMLCHGTLSTLLNLRLWLASPDRDLNAKFHAIADALPLLNRVDRIDLERLRRLADVYGVSLGVDGVLPNASAPRFHSLSDAFLRTASQWSSGHPTVLARF